MRSDNRLEESYIFESLNSLARPALISARGGIVSRYRPPPHAAGKMLLKLFAQRGGLLYNTYVVVCYACACGLLSWLSVRLRLLSWLSVRLRATLVAARAPAGAVCGNKSYLLRDKNV